MKLLKRKNNFGSKFPRVIEKFFGNKDNEFVNEYSNNIPAVNIIADNNIFNISLLVPGINKKDLKVEVEDNQLVIKCEKEFKNENKDTDFYRKEYSYSSFQRIFEIPKGADTDKIKAKLKKGILKIEIPRKREFFENLKNIEVQ